MTRLTVYYDARCGLCCAVRDWLSRQPALVPLDCEPKSDGQNDLVVRADTGEVWAGDSAWLMILWALPGAIQETLQTGRVYVFSRQFFEELPQRFSGPGRLRFILQPLVAILLGVRCGLADAKSGQSPYLFAMLFHAHKRKELLHSGLLAVGHLLAMGILLDAVAQLLIYKQIHPGAALVIGPALVCVPYAVARCLTTRLARQLKVHRSVTS